MSATQKATRHAILMAALEAHRSLEALDVTQWNTLERSIGGELARQLRSLSDAVFADQQRRGERYGRT